MATEEEILESRAATGQVFATYTPAEYPTFYDDMNTRHGKPSGVGKKAYTKEVLPDITKAPRSSDDLYIMIAFPIRLAIDEEEVALMVSDPNANELTFEEYKDLQA